MLVCGSVSTELVILESIRLLCQDKKFSLHHGQLIRVIDNITDLRWLCIEGPDRRKDDGAAVGWPPHFVSPWLDATGSGRVYL